MSDCRSAGSGSLFAVKAARIIPVASDVLENGYLVIRDGRIEAVTASLGADAGIDPEAPACRDRSTVLDNENVPHYSDKCSIQTERMIPYGWYQAFQDDGR